VSYSVVNYIVINKTVAFTVGRKVSLKCMTGCIDMRVVIITSMQVRDDVRVFI